MPRSLRTLLLAFAALAVALPAAAQGELIIVDDPEDFSDFSAPYTVAQLPGPDGRITLREAVFAANYTPGPQTIHFNVPVERWPTLNSDRVTIYADYGVFHVSDDSLTIDGTSQTAFTGDTNPDGNEVAFYGQHPNSLGTPMIWIDSDYNTIKGLDRMQRRGYGIHLSETAEHNRIIGNTISGPLYAAVRIEGSHNVVGGTASGEGNRLSSGNDGVRVEQRYDTTPTANRIVGNYLTGYSAAVRVRNGPVGTIIGGPTPEERNVIADAGHLSSEGFPDGNQMMIQEAIDTVIEGNYIGLTADGMASAGQRGPSGVHVRDSDGTVIRDNVISGIHVEGVNHHAGSFFGWAIEIEGESDGSVVVGNQIGTTADGTGAVPNLNGIRVGPWFGSPAPTNTTIGGTDLSASNVVFYNERLGIAVEPTTTGVRVLGNAVGQNGLVGLDLGRDGPTANDAADHDEGANRLQNHPGLQSATLDGTMLTVAYAVDTEPANAAYPLRVEFFEADTSGEEGARFLGADTYTAADHPAYRIAVLDVTGSGLSAGAFVLGTATDAAGNTSEFGSTVEVSGGAAAVTVSAMPASPPVTIPAQGGTFQFTVTLTNTTGQSQTFEAWSAVTGPVNRNPVVVPQTVTLPPGRTVTRTLTQTVPGNAPAGTYTYTVNLGTFGAAVAASDSFTLTKQGSTARGTDAATDWPVSGWDEAAQASAFALPDGFALSAVHPNPTTGNARLRLDLAEGQAVTAAVYDALGRRVAVLHDGRLDAGAHAFVLNGASLPAGVYVVRVVGETFTATRHATLLR